MTMNKVTELHYQFTPLDARLTDTVEQANEKILHDIRMAEANAEVTKQFAVGFKRWTQEMGFRFRDQDDKWYSSDMYYSGCAYTDDELYDLYLTSLND